MSSLCNVDRIGYFNISEIETAILEPNGKISFLPKSSNRPATPDDLDINPSPATIDVNIIIDGRILYENLKNSGHDEMWLQKELVSQGFEKPEEVFLATIDNENNLCVYRNSDLENSHDYFS